jgi:hypothetical protein
MTRKFKFLGYGNKLPFPGGNYPEMNQETHYWFVDDENVFVVGKVYEALYVHEFNDPKYQDDARFDLGNGDDFCQELQFFQEVFEEEDWIDFVIEPSVEELAQMNASAEELRLQFEGE